MNLPVNHTPVARRLVLWGVAMLLLGLVGGLGWVWLADPAQWEVRPNGIVLTQAASTGQFSVVVVFVLIGVVLSLAWAVGLAWKLEDVGWFLAPFVIVLTMLAAVLAWQVGLALGPPEPATVTGATVGDLIPANLEIDGLAPFLVWPIFGLVGLLGGTWAGRARHDDEHDVVDVPAAAS